MIVTRRYEVPITRSALVLTTFSIALMAGGADGLAPLEESEARTLVALVPDVRDARQEGFEVYVHLEEAGGYNFDDYFIYTVGVPNEFSQGLIGHYAVNKWTAHVWNSTMTIWECSSDLEQLQRTLRESHGMTEEVIQEYRDRPWFAGETSAGYMRCRED